MISFFVKEADYIYFVGGLGFFILAAVCFVLWKEDRRNIPWIWLGAFGLTRGLNKWVNILLQYQDQDKFYYYCGMILTLASLLFLTEFGRLIFVHRFQKRITVWVYLPLLAFILLVWKAYGPSGADAFIRYVFGFGGGILASLAFYNISRERQFPEALWIFRLSIALGLYALSQAIAFESPFLFAAVLNAKEFLQFFGLPIIFFRSLLVVSISLILLTWTWKTSKSYTNFMKGAYPNLYRFFVLFFCFVVVAGWFVTEHLGKRGEQEAQEELLSYAEITASAFDPKDIAALSGSLSDYDRPEFRKLKEQLAVIRKSNDKFRFVYLMGIKDQKIFFLVDAEVEESDDYSPPGQVYEEASEKLIASFADGRPFVEGPFTDRWGTWVSGFAPVKDPSTNGVLAIAGVDINAVKFNTEILDYRLPGIIFTFTLCLVIIWFASFLALLSESSLNIAASETRFKAIFHNAPQAVFILEIETKKILEVNPFMTDWLGMSRGELLSKTWTDLFRADAAPSWAEVLDSHKSGTAFTQEYYLKGNSHRISVPVELSGISLQYDEKKCVLIFMHDITERKRFEAELKKSEEYFRSLLENSLDIVTVFKPDGMIVYESSSVELALGYKPEEIVGKRAFDFIHPGDLPAVLGTIAQGLKEHGSVKTLEFRFRHKDGSWRIFEGRGRSHLNNPAIQGIVVNSRDITERKQFELDLKAAKEYAENLIETANVLVVSLDKEGVIKVFNKTAEAVTGFNSEEVIGKNWFETLVPKSHYPHVFEIFQRNREGVTVKNFENPILTKSGQVRYVIWQNSDVREQGRITGCLSFGMDITEKKKAEEELIKLSSAVEQSPVSIVMTDINGNIQYCNKKFEQISGYSAEEVTGQNPRILKSGETSSEEYKALWSTILSGREWHGEFHNRRKDGSLYWESAVIVPVRDSGGTTTGFLAIKEDITEKKQAEQSLRETEDKFKLAFENSMDSLIWADVETGMLVDCNKAAEILFEKPKNEIVGQHQETLHPPEERDHCREQFKKQALGNVPSTEIPIMTKTGKIKMASITAAVVDIKGKKIVQGIFRDVTERKRLEEEAQRRLHELEVFYKASFGREERILELKSKVAELEKKLAGKA